MKNKYITSFIFLVFKTTAVFCTTHVIVPTGSYPNFMFSPNSVTANLGDTISFNLGIDHYPIEVDSTTWSQNGNTSNGGFEYSPSSSPIIYVINQVKTYYYVCGYHYAMGMKGRIFVNNNTTGINSLANHNAPSLEIFPNPVFSKATIQTNVPAGKQNQIRIFDAAGKCVYEKENVSSVLYLDLSAFTSGIYYVSLKFDDVYLERKLIISR